MWNYFLTGVLTADKSRGRLRRGDTDNLEKGPREDTRGSSQKVRCSPKLCLRNASAVAAKISVSIGAGLVLAGVSLCSYDVRARD